MELTFNKVDNKYEAEFELSADANLHVEFKNAASIKLYQRTTGSGWDLVNDVKNAVGKATDVDLVSLIYPKFVKVVCVQEPTYATITSDGEITEIKAQSKEIEVTSNGTTEVTPDAGFSYLNSVKVKTNVATSGGGVGYLYFENVPPMLESLMFSSLINDGTRIIPSFLCGFNSQGKEENITVHKIAAMYGYTFDGMKITEDFLREFMSIGGIVEITEEEFYRMPHNVVLEDGASDDIKIVFEDLMSKISSYPSDEKFDSPLSSYGYDSISFGGNSFTRVGKYSLNVFGGRDIIYLMISEGDNPEDGWGLYRDNTVSPKEYGLNYPG